jgi:hypothetical protein
VEGDYIQVTLRNTLPFDINLEPSGVKYAAPTVAAPGQTVTDVWAAPASTAACNANGETSQMWHYRSTVDPVAHNAAGLFGPIVITRQGSAKADATPIDVDKELFVVFQVRPAPGCSATPGVTASIASCIWLQRINNRMSKAAHGQTASAKECAPPSKGCRHHSTEVSAAHHACNVVSCIVQAHCAPSDNDLNA